MENFYELDSDMLYQINGGKEVTIKESHSETDAIIAKGSVNGTTDGDVSISIGGELSHTVENSLEVNGTKEKKNTTTVYVEPKITVSSNTSKPVPSVSVGVSSTK